MSVCPYGNPCPIAGKRQTIFDHPLIPSLNKEGTEWWLTVELE